MRRICVIGTGYVGLVTGTCFAELGNQVACVDIDEAKIKLLQTGGMPIYEPGLSELVQRNLAVGRLCFTTSYAEAISHCAQVGDYTTRGILEEMVRDEEEHIDWLETQLETIDQVGLENYLTQQIHGD